MQVRQIQRWLMAARQDKDPRIMFLHASYGVGNLDILRQIIPDWEIERISGINPLALHRELSAFQDLAAKQV